MNSKVHKLLLRQLKKCGLQDNSDPQFRRFVDAVNDAYFSADEDQRLLQHAIELSSREMVTANRELSRLVAKADALAMAKSQFLANMSHEIRTPLNGIIGLSEMLMDTLKSEEERRLVELSQRSAVSLLRIINDVLDISKIEAGKMSIIPVDTDVRKCADGLIEIFVAALKTKGIEFVLEVSPHLPAKLRIDEARLRQVLTNLIGNSVKFTPQHGAIMVHLFTEQSDSDQIELRIAVADTGIGIGEEKLKLIFQPFSQADESTTRQYGGTGLGLSISQRIIELMGGRLWVRSREGVGSVFQVAIPCQVVSGAEVKVSSRPSTALAFPKTLRVLLAEDNPINQRVAQHALTKFNCAVVTVENGRQAIDAFREGDFDVILMDCQMPVLSGFDAARAIRADPRSKNVPIVALTALAMEGDRQLCLDAGMDDYLSKPFKREELREVLRRWCSRDP